MVVFVASCGSGDLGVLTGSRQQIAAPRQAERTVEVLSTFSPTSTIQKLFLTRFVQRAVEVSNGSIGLEYVYERSYVTRGRKKMEYPKWLIYDRKEYDCRVSKTSGVTKMKYGNIPILFSDPSYLLGPKYVPELKVLSVSGRSPQEIRGNGGLDFLNERLHRKAGVHLLAWAMADFGHWLFSKRKIRLGTKGPDLSGHNLPDHLFRQFGATEVGISEQVAPSGVERGSIDGRLFLGTDLPAEWGRLATDIGWVRLCFVAPSLFYVISQNG